MKPRPKGPESPAWRGGRYVSPQDGVMIYQPDHPRARKNGYVPEHVVIVEAALGHSLDRRHPVHHVDEDNTNNVPPNLVACEDQAYHMILHQRQRALDACGDPSADRCSYCKGYDRQDQMVGGPKRRGRYHRDCGTKYEVARYHKNKGATDG